uniref:Uncharacterized protein n=1 Tax=Arundo donax TaxID=35708 RepID=A0A0A9ETL1_ARUDO
MGGAWLCTHLWEHYQSRFTISFKPTKPRSRKL